MRVKNWSKKYYSSIYQYCLLHINDPYEAEDFDTRSVYTFLFQFYIDIKNMEKLRIIFIQLPEIPLKIITKEKRYSIRGTAKIRGL